MKPYIYISENNLQTIQAIIKARIAKGFKAEDLSFLIGRAPFYISITECGTVQTYTEQDIILISAALNERIPYPEDTRPNQSLLKISLERHLYEARYYHICTCYSALDKEYVQFIFNEDLNPNPAFLIIKLEKHQKSLIIRNLNELIISGYFDHPKWPYQIYQELNNKPGLMLNPEILKDILNDYCLNDGIGGLDKRFENENYQYVYNAAPANSIFLTINQKKHV